MLHQDEIALIRAKRMHWGLRLVARHFPALLALAEGLACLTSLQPTDRYE